MLSWPNSESSLSILLLVLGLSVLALVASLWRNSKPIIRPLRMQKQRQPRTKNSLLRLAGLKPWQKIRRSRQSWYPLPKLRPQRWLPKQRTMHQACGSCKSCRICSRVPRSWLLLTLLIAVKREMGMPVLLLLALPVFFILQQSPQRKTVSANKRGSVHSPLHLPVCQPEEHLSSDGSYLLDSSRDKVLVVGEDTNDKLDTSFVLLSNCRDILLCNKCLGACGGRWYSSALAQDQAGLKAGDHHPTGKAYACYLSKGVRLTSIIGLGHPLNRN